MLEMLEKLINEHGSSTILRERLELFSDKYAALEEKNLQLKTRNEELESQLAEARDELTRLKAELNSKNRGSENLSVEQYKIVHFMFENNNEFRIENIMNIIESDMSTTKYHVNKLVEKKLIYQSLRMGGPTTYKISDRGIEYIVESRNT